MSDGIGLSDYQFGNLRASFYFAQNQCINHIFIAYYINVKYTEITQLLFNLVFTNVYTCDIIISSKGDIKKGIKNEIHDLRNYRRKS